MRYFCGSHNILCLNCFTRAYQKWTTTTTTMATRVSCCFRRIVSRHQKLKELAMCLHLFCCFYTRCSWHQQEDRYTIPWNLRGELQWPTNVAKCSELYGERSKSRLARDAPLFHPPVDFLGPHSRSNQSRFCQQCYRCDTLSIQLSEKFRRKYRTRNEVHVKSFVAYRCSAPGACAAPEDDDSAPSVVSSSSDPSVAATPVYDERLDMDLVSKLATCAGGGWSEVLGKSARYRIAAVTFVANSASIRPVERAKVIDPMMTVSWVSLISWDSARSMSFRVSCKKCRRSEPSS